ncbi:MAG: hypothetical protein HGA99_01350 [Chlorobiaceae bacterium]|nr:hypothetical protein [Chlorobiaceae bacterium]
MDVETTKDRLLQLEKEIKSLSLKKDIEFHQQRVVKKHMALKSANGTLWIVPNKSSYDICLSGKTLVAEMTPFMRKLCGCDCTSNKQTKPKPHQPFWRVEDFQIVRKAAYHFAGLDLKATEI